MICLSCGNKIPDSSKFCRCCGVKAGLFTGVIGGLMISVLISIIKVEGALGYITGIILTGISLAVLLMKRNRNIIISLIAIMIIVPINIETVNADNHGQGKWRFVGVEVKHELQHNEYSIEGYEDGKSVFKLWVSAKPRGQVQWFFLHRKDHGVKKDHGVRCSGSFCEVANKASRCHAEASRCHVRTKRPAATENANKIKSKDGE